MVTLPQVQLWVQILLEHLTFELWLLYILNTQVGGQIASFYIHICVCPSRKCQLIHALKCHHSNEFLLHTFLALQIYSVLDARKQLLNTRIQSPHNRLNKFPTPPPTTTTTTTTTTAAVLLLLDYICMKTLLLYSV